MLGGAFEQIAGGFRPTSSTHITPSYPLEPCSVVTSCRVSSTASSTAPSSRSCSFTLTTDSTLCQWDNPEHMVCGYANQVFASVIFFGAFGTNNMFKLYPILPWCFLLGALLGLAWVLCRKGDAARAPVHPGANGREKFLSFDQYVWQPAASVLNCLNPAIALSGALNWAGNNNLTYATLGIYIAWYFQYYLKRYYTAWWGKYAYLVFAGLNVGVAISGLIAHSSSASVPVKASPSAGGETTFLNRVSTISCTTTMPVS